MAVWVGCDLVPAIAPDDWVFNPPKQDPIPIDTTATDTIDIDTLVIDTIEVDTPCTPIEYSQPQFVSGWWYIPDYSIDSVQVCAYPHCVTVAFNATVVNILDSLLNEYDPTNSYEVFADFPETFCFIAKGTNDKEHFHGEVWLRPVGFHSGWGFQCNTQAFYFFDALSHDEWLTMIDSYPSFDAFTFQYTNWDSIQYIKAFDKILECRIGRTKADLRYLPFTFPDSVYQKFITAGWDQVLY